MAHRGFLCSASSLASSSYSRFTSSRLFVFLQKQSFSSSSPILPSPNDFRYTLAILKPDVASTLEEKPKLSAFSSPTSTSSFSSSFEDKICSSIIERIHNDGFKIARGSLKEIRHLSLDEAERFYAEHRGRFFFARLISFITSGPIIPLVLERKEDEDAIARWRTLLGPTHLHRAKSESPNSLRALYALSDTRNVAHGSDSPITARREIEFFFEDFFSQLKPA
jgi:nucleoside diphosphate kinase